MREDRLDLLSDPRFITDPYPLLAQLREEEPVRPVLYHGLPAWLVTRFADAEAVYSDPRFSAAIANASDEARSVGWVIAPEMIGLSKTIVFADPPAHSRMRRLVSKAFTPRRVQALRPLVQGIADRLLDVTVPGGRMNARCSRGAATLPSASPSAICPTGSPRTCAASRSCQ